MKKKDIKGDFMTRMTKNPFLLEEYGLKDKTRRETARFSPT